MIKVIYYDSKTGNVKRFVNKVKEELKDSIKLIQVGTEDDEIIDGYLITHTTKIGQIPDKTRIFLEKYNSKIISVSTSGNTNWGKNFGLSMDKIVNIYPHIKKGIKFELSGTSDDVKKYINSIK